MHPVVHTVDHLHQRRHIQYIAQQHLLVFGKSTENIFIYFRGARLVNSHSISLHLAPSCIRPAMLLPLSVRCIYNRTAL